MNQSYLPNFEPAESELPPLAHEILEMPRRMYEHIEDFANGDIAVENHTELYIIYTEILGLLAKRVSPEQRRFITETSLSELLYRAYCSYLELLDTLRGYDGIDTEPINLES